MPIGQLDAVAAVATANKIISFGEAKKLAKEARAVVAQSGNPKATKAAVLKRFDNWAKNKFLGDSRAVSSLAKVVQEITDDTKTFTALGIQTNRVSSKGSSRVSSGESSGRRISGCGSSSRRISGGESSGRRISGCGSSSRRVSGGESSGRRVSGGESPAPRRTHRHSGGEASSYRPRYSGGESSSYRSYGGGGGRVSGGER